MTTRRVDGSRVADYQMWGEKVRARLEQAPGFVSAEQLPAVPGPQDFWTQIIAPPKWKQLIAGVMALYPTVMIVNYLLGRLVAVPFALAVLITNAIAMALVMMVFLPQLSRLLHGWLLPAAPLPIAKTVGVAVALLAVTGGCLGLFLVLFPG